jgi:hypothetical protein
MSRYFAAYFAIVGTLVFAPGGAANAGPFNIPHFNMLRPQPHFNMLRPQPHFNMLRPQISMPTPHLSNSQPGRGRDQVFHGPTGQPVTQQQSTTGTTSGNLSSNVNGGAIRPFDSVVHGPTGQPVTQQQSAMGTTSGNLSSNVSGASGGATPSRFRVIEDGGHFAVVERRSEKIVAGGFESYKAASAWIANHV